MADPENITLDDVPTIEIFNSRFRAREYKQDPSQDIRVRIAGAYKFLTMNFNMIERRDKEFIENTSRGVFKLGLFSIIVPSLINIGLGRLTNNSIFDMHYLVRFGIRSTIFAVPILFTVNHGMNVYTRSTMYLTDKYLERIESYSKLGDPTIINPFLEEENNIKI